ncbi:MAG: hypothetical protein GC191_18530 [Azospirillum sp.]|nr:hypothetical protein [Azospirillum sp.]
MSEDAFQAHATREAALAIGDWLLAGVKLTRPVRSLTRAELEHMATAAISRWITVRASRAAAGHPDPDLIAI